MENIETGPKRTQCLLCGIFITTLSGSKADSYRFTLHRTFLYTSLLNPSKSVSSLWTGDITKLGGWQNRSKW